MRFRRDQGLILVSGLFILVSVATNGIGAEPPKPGQTAEGVLEKAGWRYKPTERIPGRKNSHLFWMSLRHPTNTTFAMSDGSFNNIGSYDEAFKYYSRKCGMKPGFRLELGKHDVGTSNAGDYTIETYGTRKQRRARFTLQSATSTVRVILEETATTDEDGIYSASVFLTLGGTDAAKTEGSKVPDPSSRP